MRRVFHMALATLAVFVGAAACGSLLVGSENEEPRGEPERDGAVVRDENTAPDGSATELDGGSDAVDASIDGEVDVGGCGATPKTFHAASSPTALAIDSTGLFWTNGVATGSIAGCPLKGCGSVTTIYLQASPFSLIREPFRFFWTNIGGGADGGTVNVANELNGGAVLTVLATRITAPKTIVRAGSSLLFWLESAASGSIMRCELDQPTQTSCIGGATTFRSPLNLSGGLVADQTNIYWTEASRIALCPHNDTETTCDDTALKDVAPLSPGTIALALGGSEVYFGAPGDGIYAVAKDPSLSSKRQVVASPDPPRAITVQGSGVFWITDKEVFAAKTTTASGGLPLSLGKLATSESGPAAILADGQCVYWTTSNSITYVRQPVF